MAAQLAHLKQKKQRGKCRPPPLKAPQSVVRFDFPFPDTDLGVQLSERTCARQLAARIAKAIITAGPEPFTVYEIEVTLSNQAWHVRKRFSQFARLHSMLSVEGLALPPLPERTWTHARASDPAVVTSRGAPLHQFIQGVLADPSVNTLWEVAFFFAVPADLLPLGDERASPSNKYMSVEFDTEAPTACLLGSVCLAPAARVYRIEVTLAGDSRVVSKTFEEFTRYRESLSAVVPGARFPPFPKATWTQASAESPPVIAEREDLLSMLISFVFTTPIIRNQAATRFFFELDELDPEIDDNRPHQTRSFPSLAEGVDATLANTLSARIRSAEIVSAKGETFAIYQIEVAWGRESWICRKRYSHFRMLYENLVSAFKNVIFPPFPRATWTHMRACDPTVIAERKAKLEEVVEFITENTDISSHRTVRDFFELDSHEGFLFADDELFQSDFV